jgi:hypothetical protein
VIWPAGTGPPRFLFPAVEFQLAKSRDAHCLAHLFTLLRRRKENKLFVFKLLRTLKGSSMEFRGFRILWKHTGCKGGTDKRQDPGCTDSRRFSASVSRKAGSLHSREMNYSTPSCPPGLCPRPETIAPRAACATSLPGWPCPRQSKRAAPR